MGKYSGSERRGGRTDRRTPAKWATHLWGGIIVFFILASNGFSFNRGRDSRPDRMDDLANADSVMQEDLGDFGEELARLANLVPDTIVKTVVRDRFAPPDTVEVLKTDTLTVTLAAILLPPDTIFHVDTIYASLQISRLPAEQRGFWDVNMSPTLEKLIYLGVGVLVGIPIGGAIDNDATACIYVNETQAQCNNR